MIQVLVLTDWRRRHGQYSSDFSGREHSIHLSAAGCQIGNADWELCCLKHLKHGIDEQGILVDDESQSSSMEFLSE